jgi:iron-sulfur cluster repair protein YtfE (RIC family)
VDRGKNPTVEELVRIEDGTMSDVATPAEAVWAFAEHEHRELARGIDRIHDIACEIGERPKPELSADVLAVLRWMDRDFAPHVAWEESWLYPEIDAKTGTAWATRSARFDHGQIRGMASRVTRDQRLLSGAATPALHAQLRCHLFSLEALIRAHLEREERFLIPLLAAEDAMAPELVTINHAGI